MVGKMVGNQADYDLLVIGGGSGGVRAARMAASRGVKVGLCEGGRLGGTCVNLGCIPKKFLAMSAEYGTSLHEATDYGWRLTIKSYDWLQMMANKDKEIARLNQIYGNLLQGAGVIIHPSWAKLEGRDARGNFIITTSAKERLTASRVLIATGSQAKRAKFKGAEHCLISDDMFSLDALPERALILGGGYIAIEFASILNGLGVDTTLAYRGRQILRGFDDDVAKFLSTQLVASGIKLWLNAKPEHLEKIADRTVALSLNLDGKPITWKGELVLSALGREANSQGLGIESLGLNVEQGKPLNVDDGFETGVSRLYAFGDVIGNYGLTPVATAEAMVFVARHFPLKEAGMSPANTLQKMDYQNIPTAIFSHPNVAVVGFAEAEARRLHPDDITIFEANFKPLRQTLISQYSGSSQNFGRVYMKMVVRSSDDKVLGLHMVGPEAGEIVQGFAVALKAGATKSDFDQTIGIHPTMAEEFVTMRQARPSR